MDSEQKGNVQLFTGECLFLPVTICVVSEDEEDSWSFSDNSIKEGDYNSSDVDGDLTKLDACTSQEKSRASPYWLVDMNKFQDVQKGASKIVPDAIIQKVIGQKKKLFEENDARLQSKKDSDLKVSKRSVFAACSRGEIRNKGSPQMSTIKIEGDVKLASIMSYKRRLKRTKVNIMQCRDLRQSQKKQGSDKRQKKTKGREVTKDEKTLNSSLISESHLPPLESPAAQISHEAKRKSHEYMHQKLEAETNNFYCKLCNFSTNETKAFIQHIEGHSDNRVSERPQSDYTSMNSKQPPQKKRKTKLLACSKCGFSTKEKWDFEAHTKSHVEKNAIKNEQDSKSKASTQNKSEVHTGQEEKKIYSCQLCHVTFQSALLLERHKNVHLISDTVFSCDQCKYSTYSSYNLKCHIRIHTGEKPFQCNVCQSFFRTLSHLVRHKRVHVNSKNEDCNVKSKESKSMLGNQEVDNGSESRSSLSQRHSCEHCQYSTNNTYNLKCHMRIHTGEKPYQCKECQFSFRTQSQLSRHQRLHTCVKSDGETGESGKASLPASQQHNRSQIKSECSLGQVHSCNECDYTTLNSYNLKVHLRKHTNERPYRCSQCDAAFRTQSHLYRHKRCHLPKTEVEEDKSD
nr:PREDICTED: zinc finger protein 502-like isoform X1 [Lepisosteus oculatus]XP_015201830.1 PREDICTED: zinc finger protein 502-like isoform X1 [Lepisosteus oculatus]XP_015201837.1 PREDICTED: zinc finger protein 502-like isoform X1 [Lepisosteus oculatus]XP_015201845.1 PREDICTED: zinc finger protein 502-like isoform X1 [Lepisosteus oculatus]XP_015201852.1 PREDICTED: zinc finger protein 502-like isoform X1 [Lepisosteus oculatus]XP_015201862.1 PREDICTED: zinc finger protein 502-like isoform X1 [Lep